METSRELPSLQSHFWLSVYSLGLLASATSCVTTEVARERGAPYLPLDFAPGNLDFEMVEAGSYHNVKLVFEINRMRDLPAHAKGVLARVLPELRMDPETRSIAEVYHVLGIHEVSYSNGVFEVGGYRYHTRKNARLCNLYVFKKRRAEFRFRYRTQPIVVKADGYWIPSVYYRVMVGGTGRAGSAGRWQTETLQVGLNTIESDSRKDFWLLNGRPYTPSPDDLLVLSAAQPNLGTK